MTVTKQQVIATLAELRANRPRLAADRMIRGYLQRFGNGATNIGELSPELYENVWRAAGGSISFEEFYGVALDVQPAPQAGPVASAPPVPSRIRTPLVKDLTEKLAAAKAKTKRSSPGGRVDTGAPAQFGDEDAARDYPSDGWKMS